jgi:hypothetical protein
MDTEEFTYEGGSSLFHFSPRANGLSSYMDCNVAFFADDETHALDILRRMFQFVVDCNIAYNGRYNEADRETYTNLASRLRENDAIISKFNEWIKALDAGTVKVELAPINQFFKVGWADNDTI